MKQWLLLAALTATLPAGAAMYKWVDAAGNVHYSDQPPPGDAAQQQTIKGSRPVTAPQAPPSGDATATPAEAAKPAAGSKSIAEQEMEFRKRRLHAAEADAKAQKDAEELAEKKRNCAQAQNRVAALQQGGRITRYNNEGEQVFLSDEEIGRELGNARSTADSWCK